MEITVSKNGTGLVKKCLDNYFKEYGVVREVIISNNVKGEDAFDRFNVKRYMVVSEELNKRFPEKIVRLSFEEYYNTAHDILGITVVEADKSVEFKYVDIEFSKKQIKEYYNYAKENDLSLLTGIDRLDTVSGGLGLLGCDRDLLADQMVHQGRFPNIRAANNCNKSGFKIWCH